MARTANRTGLRSLDEVGRDKRVTDIYRDANGIWVDLARGFNFEGQASFRCDTVQSVLQQMRLVCDGEAY